MRVGLNPHKDKIQEVSPYLHQVVVPVFIPHQEDYFKDSFAILQLCLNSLFATVHNKTYISIVNNGSCVKVKEYLDTLYKQLKIHEVIHTDNIGKLNAIIKGVVGNTIELVTITDADVLFLPNWQCETAKVFKAMPKAGVVGIVPQFNMFKYNCGNVIFDNLFYKKLKFIPVKSVTGIINFYKSIGWDNSYNKDFLKYSLGLEYKEVKVYVGSGHFVATYKKQMFNETQSYFNFKLGGNSENYLDTLPLKYDYWRVTTYDNYAYHMGNKLEGWMSKIEYGDDNKKEVVSGFAQSELASSFLIFLKNKIFLKVLFNDSISKLFYRLKKLPKEIARNYNKIVPILKSK
ncbi:hypothetical protein H4V97_001357 [Flavobacterium sp. CG_23.5]|uniref:glycosyltransferase family A protein n=1 Tax=Flavobacterium sp. CG_23.5 TaxID=2760708 RepID=UPI001AE860E6|nr:glycosyltransferase family A protein [Flavobacterium sp. CG_23.5]MBP2283039.1 hypothetical protein [Flavobacterium sp. CG_23.5]